MKLNIELQNIGDDGFHIFCKVTINGKKCRAIIDTGASKTVINSNTFNTLGLEELIVNDDNQMLGIVPVKMDFTFVKLNSNRLGKFELKDLAVGMVDLEHVIHQYKKLKIKPFDIIIGGDVLTKGKAVIDYNLKCLTLS